MKDVEGWEVSSSIFDAESGANGQVGKSAYNTKRYTPTTIVVL